VFFDYIFLQLQIWLPEINGSPTLAEFVRISPTTSVDVHYLCVHAGVDDIYFAFKSCQ
jgi:hypothetical protein